MPGPYSSDHRSGADGLPFSDTHPSEPIPTPPAYPPPVAAYPGALPRPMPYPKPPRRRPANLGILMEPHGDDGIILSAQLFREPQREHNIVVIARTGKA